jgi:hypothetical protein
MLGIATRPQTCAKVIAVLSFGIMTATAQTASAQQYVSFANDIPTPETLAESERRAPAVITNTQRRGLFGRRRTAPTAEAPVTYRIPKGTRTLPALEPGATDEMIEQLQRDLNEPYLNPVPQYEPSRRGPIKSILLFWKPEPLVEIRPPGPPPNVILDDDPRQADRDWNSIIASLPPEPSTPTIEIFLSSQVGRYKGMIFPALGGNRYPTPKGLYTVNFKSENHYSRKYDAPMPYSLFFTDQCAIHEGSLYLYSHGCIHVNRPTAQLLFKEAVAGKTRVRVYP